MKLIIETDDSVTPEQALDAARRVIELGKITMGRYGPQHCAHIVFSSDGTEVDVTQNAQSERFFIRQREQ